MRVLIGAMVRQVPEVLDAFLETLRWQDADAEVSYYFIDDNDDERSKKMLKQRGVCVVSAGERKDATYSVGEVTHEWNTPSFHRLAFEKQRILDHALAEGYDAVWLVDSDLLCAPDTLRSLIENEREITSAVFWTQWTPGAPLLPQVWQQHPYGFDGAGWDGSTFLQALESRALVRVRGLGACTLIRAGALRKGIGFWPLLPDLPAEGMWQGEDRHFCVKAERLHQELYADAWPRVWHCYRPSDRARIAEVLADLRVKRGPKPKARDGSDVNFTVEPCEEPALALYKEHVRGRLGELNVLPEIEAALREIRVGDSRFVHAYFPESWNVPEYRNSRRTLRVRLLGVDSS